MPVFFLSHPCLFCPRCNFFLSQFFFVSSVLFCPRCHFLLCIPDICLFCPVPDLFVPLRFFGPATEGGTQCPECCGFVKPPYAQAAHEQQGSWCRWNVGQRTCGWCALMIVKYLRPPSQPNLRVPTRSSFVQEHLRECRRCPPRWCPCWTRLRNMEFVLKTRVKPAHSWRHNICDKSAQRWFATADHPGVVPGSTRGGGRVLCCGTLACRCVVLGGHSTWQQECWVEQGTCVEVCSEHRGLVEVPAVAVLVTVVLVVVTEAVGRATGLKRWPSASPHWSPEPAGEAAAAESAWRPGRARVGCQRYCIAVRRWLPNIVVVWCRRLHQWWWREAKVILLGPGLSPELAALVVFSWPTGRWSSDRTSTKTGANHCKNLATSGQRCLQRPGPRWLCSLYSFRGRRYRQTPRVSWTCRCARSSARHRRWCWSSPSSGPSQARWTWSDLEMVWKIHTRFHLLCARRSSRPRVMGARRT